MKNIILITIFFISFFPCYSYAEISSINFFNFFEIKFNNNKKIDNTYINQEKKWEQDKMLDEEQEYEFEYQLKNKMDILDVSFINNELLISLKNNDFELLNYYFYINGVRIKTKLIKEKYYSDIQQITYSIEKKNIQHAIFNWDNEVYFKHIKNGLNSKKYTYFHWDLADYDWYTQQVSCNGLVDKVIMRDAYGKEIYVKTGELGNKINIVTLTNKRTLDDGYYEAKIYCSNSIKNLYFIYNISFKFQEYNSTARWETYYGDYVSQELYEKQKNQ